MSVIKRDRKASKADLVNAIAELTPLLQEEGEADAAQALAEAANDLRSAQSESPEEKAAVDKIMDAFEGEHELMAYTHKREGAVGQWTIAEQLYNASSRVLTLARRMHR